MKNLISFLTIVWAIAAIMDTAYADPIVNDTIGKFSDGEGVTIAGENFGFKDPALPIIWASFENGKINPNSNLCQRSSWDEIESLQLTNTNNPKNSSFCVVGYFDNGKSHSFRIDKEYWTTIYHYQKRYYDFNATSNQKFWRLWPDSGGNDFLSLYHSSSGMCYNETEGYVGGCVGGYQGKDYQKDNWLIEEFVWKHSDNNGVDNCGVSSPNSGLWIYTRNGNEIQRRENVNNGSSNHVQLRTDNFTDSAALPPAGASVYMDDIYIDDTCARVMIGNAKNFKDSTIREIQIPLKWSDNSITINVNRGTFISDEEVYLFIIDANSQVSEGFPITIGSEKNHLPLSPPTYLEINEVR